MRTKIAGNAGTLNEDENMFLMEFISSSETDLKTPYLIHK